jgi:enoyl-CoA hydratase
VFTDRTPTAECGDTAETRPSVGLVSRVVPAVRLRDIALDVTTTMCGYSPHGLAMMKKVPWSNVEGRSLGTAIDLENRNQLLVRMTTQNLHDAITARKQKRPPCLER